MKAIRLLATAVVGAILAGYVGITILGGDSGSVRAADTDEDQPAPEAVEDDMHEFMEYVFQPTYLRLKASMSEQPPDNQAWKAIKSDSLILAEGGNLLLFRAPEDEADAWNEQSVSVRELAGELYAAAKARDYDAARERYTAMLHQCNACHDEFADGEHQLSP